MSPDPVSIASVLPNLSIAATAIVALVYVVRFFVNHLKERDKLNSEQIEKRETAMRTLEKEVRDSIMGQLIKNTQAFERVLDHFNTSHGRK